MAEQAQVSEVQVCCWAYEGHAGLLRSALEENAKLLQRRDSHQRTALHWACASGQTEIVQMLLSLGAQVIIIARILNYTWINEGPCSYTPSIKYHYLNRCSNTSMDQTL